MKRRHFIQTGALASAIPFVSLHSCASPKGETQSEGNEAPDPFVLEELTVEDLQKGMEDGSFTSRRICELYIDRIEKFDQQEGGLNSVIEINPDALSIADALDSERASGNIRGPLHGIPIMIKDNIDTGDKMMTTAGSLALAGTPASKDAFIVEQLRDAGAVLLGKTNLSEWANFRSTRSSSGWSGRGRQTRNPFALDRSPCGSSAGSGSAVSGNMCALTIGTETNGSIVCPASSNGIVGIKPTVGLWSRSGIIPISETQDTAGPMARTVADAVALLGPLTGVDPRDERTNESSGKSKKDYRASLKKDGLKGKRIGVLSSAFGFHEKVDKVLNQAIETLRGAGAEVVKDIELPSPEGYGNAGFEVLLYEFKAGLNAYLATREGVSVQTLADVIKFNSEHAEEELTYFQQEIMVMAEARGDLDTPEYKDALSLCLKTSRGGIDTALSENKLDAIMGPTGGPAWPIDVINGDHYGGGSSTPAARAGYPNISVPAGFVHGLPVGVSFFGGPYQESKLIEIAYGFEQANPVRKAPKLPRTLDLS